MIIYNNISKKFDKNFEVKIEHLELYDNNIYALLGENGAGKTTTIRMTLGLLKPTSGTIMFDGLNVFRDNNVKRTIGYVPDVPNLYESLTGFEQIQFISNLYGLNNIEYIYELMKKFHIYDERNQVISSYSKGMKQKISIICAVVHKPEILILDEPFTALDPSNIKVVKEYISEYIKEGNHLVLFSTHDLDVANNICTSAIIMRNGKITQEVQNFREMGYSLEQLYFDNNEGNVVH